MFIRMFGRHEHGGSLPLPPPTEDPLLAAVRRHVKRMRRLKIHVLAWALGITLLTTLWMVHEWQANGAFRHFGHEGNPGDWNPTLWALGIGIWTLVVGFKALQVLFEKPVTEAEVERAVERMRPSLTTKGLQTTADLRRFAFERLEGASRLRFHVAAWVFGMLVITPLWALIEWQDNGGFERWSNNSRPGDWDPWILTVGGVWALVIAILALYVYLRPAIEPAIIRKIRRPTPRP
jgi:hypothetical protein